MKHFKYYNYLNRILRKSIFDLNYHEITEKKRKFVTYKQFLKITKEFDKITIYSNFNCPITFHRKDLKLKFMYTKNDIPREVYVKSIETRNIDLNLKGIKYIKLHKGKQEIDIPTYFIPTKYFSDYDIFYNLNPNEENLCENITKDKIFYDNFYDIFYSYPKSIFDNPQVHLIVYKNISEKEKQQLKNKIQGYENVKSYQERIFHNDMIYSFPQIYNPKIKKKGRRYDKIFL